MLTGKKPNMALLTISDQLRSYSTHFSGSNALFIPSTQILKRCFILRSFQYKVKFLAFMSAYWETTGTLTEAMVLFIVLSLFCSQNCLRNSFSYFVRLIQMLFAPNVTLCLRIMK